jgi:alkylhydroperoxidase family enzyme
MNMSVLTPVDPATAPPETRQILENVAQRLGRTPNMVRVMAHAPRVLKGYLDFTNVMQQTTVPGTLRSQLTIYVAELTGSQYFQTLGAALAARDGLSAEDIAMAKRGAALDFAAATALRFAGRFVQRRGDLPEEDVIQLRDAGYTDEQLVEIVALVALNVFRGTFNLALGTELDAPPARPVLAQR